MEIKGSKKNNRRKSGCRPQCQQTGKHAGNWNRRMLILLVVLCMFCVSVEYLPSEISLTESAMAADAAGTADTSWYDDNSSASSFTIYTADELAGLASLVNAGNSFSGKTVTLGNNIDLSTYSSWTPIGKGTAFSGTFDGAGYTVSNLTVSGGSSDSNGMGLFAVNAGTIKNLSVVDGSVSGYQYCGGIAGKNTGTINACSFTGTVIASSASCGGITGYNYSSGRITNCYNLGSISSGNYRVGGIVGYLAEGTVSNCYNAGSTTSDMGHCQSIAGECYQGTVSNCYYLNTATADSNATAKTADEFASGEVAYLLNGSVTGGTVWYQNLDNGETPDAVPVPLSGHGTVYYGYGCGKTEQAFSNIYVKACFTEYTAHSFLSNGFCEVCGQYEPAEFANGSYQITNAGNLFWFSAMVNGDDSHADFEEQNAAANATLTVDLDLSGCEGYIPIGYTEMDYNSSSFSFTGYAGCFDGAGHVISSLTIENSVVGSIQTVGLFGTLSGTVKHLGMEEFYFDRAGGSDGRFGALAGQIISGGTVEDCYVANSTVDGDNKIAGAVAGANYGGTIKNCHVYNCTVTAYKRYGYFVGDNENDKGTLSGSIINCYSDRNLVGTQDGTVDELSEANVSAERFASGEITWRLNGKTSENVIWYQMLRITEYPAFDGKVVGYEEASGYFNYIDTDVYSMTITWGTLEFTYQEASQGTWNTQTRQYEGEMPASWSCSTGSNIITVTNNSSNSETAVSVSLKYIAQSGYEWASASFDSAAAQIASGEKQSFTLTLTGTADTAAAADLDHTKIGTVTITMGVVE